MRGVAVTFDNGIEMFEHDSTRRICYGKIMDWDIVCFGFVFR